MDQGGAAILLAVRGPLCAAGDRDLPTVKQSWKGGVRGGIPAPGPWERGTFHTSPPSSTRGGRRELIWLVGGTRVGEFT